MLQVVTTAVKSEQASKQTYLQRVNTEYHMQTQNSVGSFLHLQPIVDQ